MCEIMHNLMLLHPRPDVRRDAVLAVQRLRWVGELLHWEGDAQVVGAALGRFFDEGSSWALYRAADTIWRRDPALFDIALPMAIPSVPRDRLVGFLDLADRHPVRAVFDILQPTMGSLVDDGRDYDTIARVLQLLMSCDRSRALPAYLAWRSSFSFDYEDDEARAKDPLHPERLLEAGELAAHPVPAPAPALDRTWRFEWRMETVRELDQSLWEQEQRDRVFDEWCEQNAGTCGIVKGYRAGGRREVDLYRTVTRRRLHIERV
jgi:hypothetical protein